MPLIGTARFEVGRERFGDTDIGSGGDSREIAQSDRTRGNIQPGNSRGQIIPGVSSLNNDHRDSHPPHSSRNTGRANSSRANRRRQTLPLSLSPSDNDNDNRASSSSRSNFDTAGNDETSRGGSPGPPPSHATAPPPYKTVESLALHPGQQSTQLIVQPQEDSIVQSQEDRNKDRSQGSRTKPSSRAVLVNFMKNLQSRVHPSDRRVAASQVPPNRSDVSDVGSGRHGNRIETTDFARDWFHALSSNRQNSTESGITNRTNVNNLGSGRHGDWVEITDYVQDWFHALSSNRPDSADQIQHGRINRSERYPDRREDVWTPLTDFMKDLSLNLLSSRSDTDSSYSDSSSSSDSDDSSNDRDLVQVVKTYRPVGRGSSRRDGGGTIGVLRTVTDKACEVLEVVQKEAVAMIEEERKTGGRNERKPAGQRSFLLDMALRAGKEMVDGRPETIYAGPRYHYEFGPRFIRG